jgi:hypothetical protein
VILRNRKGDFTPIFLGHCEMWGPLGPTIFREGKRTRRIRKVMVKLAKNCPPPQKK